MTDFPFSYQSLQQLLAKNAIFKHYESHGYLLLGNEDSDCNLKPIEQYHHTYKFRINPSPAQVEAAWDIIAPFIIEEGICAKVEFARRVEKWSDPKHPERGKFITLYADYMDGPVARDWERVLITIQRMLEEQNITPGPIPLDKAVITRLGAPERSLIHYRDERERRAIYDPSRAPIGGKITPEQEQAILDFKPNYTTHDPLQHLCLDMTKHKELPDKVLMASGRKQRQQFLLSPMTREEFGNYVRFSHLNSELTFANFDIERVEATLKALGLPPLKEEEEGVTQTESSSRELSKQQIARLAEQKYIPSKEEWLKSLSSSQHPQSP